ncbi:MAG TPA: tetratricopeptide repeat protein [Gemmatimonadaceae bacterium]|jgi:Flp pilus assembly protein TadD|nr:tetratricopeptide repeat protein [Gemmatimonadaceae bacterium]
MADPTSAPAIPARAANASLFIATIFGIVALVGLMLSFDLFLARIDRRESDAHAADEYGAGVRLLQAGRPSDAVERFASAAAIERQNVNYALALADALLRAGRTTEADTTLRELLDRAENDGAVNLTMAHVMIREGRDQDAKAYFHRAIFGRWGADSLERRTQARFELIDLLSRRGDARELLAELLPLEEVSPDSVALRRRLGTLFLRAESPSRAANMFREALRHDPADADSYAGMGEAALALGNFRTARTDFLEAEQLRPDDQRLAVRLALTDTVVALDPTARGIGAALRAARSQTLLARTLLVVNACSIVPPALADSARGLLAAAANRNAARGPNEMAGEAMIGVAVDLWASRPPSCDRTNPDEALRLVQRRLAQ